ncbi:membrane protein involved in the export of O-antigen and teichoic acid [Legionella oakridgensis ATCC 33761 = DSM 21215]|uniref:Membrane protein involved in the export of O-antigen and teichoic acid n=3 Tax=Legionella oakridgensis TaxID=29423 RepID=W0BGS9_9GAMM|nr:membrane protein involved in the export of O-antigen and teichoic acid [Legionella oakridgensis ATCC 33761 = DSM 21215]ETO92870.1 membrane protein involved in the export of O-antigen and teichoic acid [Legionella oakridgensis RV-2-2007]KTD37023.1 Teichuronic acid biosynthesis protein TuaB [Legionella oakridgensis]STY20668.1 colanic acid exporter [Legionella longbeachae]
MIVRGTVLGQGLVFLLSPIITRIYAPEDFGIYTVYFSLLSILSIIIALRFEVAIPIAKKKLEANHLLLIALLSTLILSLFTAGIIYGWGQPLSDRFHMAKLSHYLWLLPISLVAVGFYNALSYWFVRHRSFEHIGKTKVTQGSGIVTTQITLGLMQFKPLGLLIGQTVGHTLGALTFITALLRFDRLFFKKIRPSFLFTTAKRYWRFPVFSMPSGLINALALYLPAVIISATYGSQVAGWYGLTAQVIGIPLGLIGQAIGQVYLGEGAVLKNQGNFLALRTLYIKTIRHSLMLAFPFIVLILLFAPSIFSWTFGESWYDAGLFARLLGIMFLLEFAIIGPSQNFALMEQQALGLYWNIFFVALIMLAFVPALFYSASYFTTVLYLGIAKSIGYITMAFLNLHAIGNNKKLNHPICVE